jgi:hypothetical protein
MIHPTRPPPNTPTSSTPHPRNHAAYPAPRAPLLHRCPGPESRRDAIRGKYVIVVVAGHLRQPQNVRAGAARVGEHEAGQARTPEGLDVVRDVGDERVEGGRACDVNLG